MVANATARVWEGEGEMEVMGEWMGWWPMQLPVCGRGEGVMEVIEERMGWWKMLPRGGRGREGVGGDGGKNK